MSAFGGKADITRLKADILRPMSGKHRKADGLTDPSRQGCIKTLVKDPDLEPRETAVLDRATYV